MRLRNKSEQKKQMHIKQGEVSIEWRKNWILRKRARGLFISGIERLSDAGPIDGGEHSGSRRECSLAGDGYSLLEGVLLPVV